MIMRPGDTTHTIATWLRPQNTKTAASKRQIGHKVGLPRHQSSSARITRTGTGSVKRNQHPEVGDKHLPASGHKQSKKSLAEDLLKGVCRYFKKSPPLKLPWEKNNIEPHKRRRIQSPRCVTHPPSGAAAVSAGFWLWFNGEQTSSCDELYTCHLAVWQPFP